MVWEKDFVEQVIRLLGPLLPSTLHQLGQYLPYPWPRFAIIAVITRFPIADNDIRFLLLGYEEGLFKSTSNYILIVRTVCSFSFESDGSSASPVVTV